MSTLPMPPTPEEELRFRMQRAMDLKENTELNEFHSDADVELKLNRLRIMGFYPVPDAETDIKYRRAYLAGVNEATRYLLRTPRPGGIA